MKNNTTIHEMSSRFEESRDENSYRRPSSIEDRRNVRSRSPFNVSQSQNTSIIKEQPRIKKSEPIEVVEKERNPYLYESQPKPAAQYFEDREDSFKRPPVNKYVDEDIYVPRQRPKQVKPRENPPIEVGRLESFDDSRTSRELDNRQVPRSRPLGSPARAPKAKDVNAEINTLSRFLSNTIVIKTVEDLVFQLVPEFLDELKNPKPQEQIVVKKKSAKGANKQPTFDFERKVDQTQKEAIKDHNKELMSVMDEIDKQDEANVEDIDDVDEHSHVNRIIESVQKGEMKNTYVASRDVDTLGIKFETNKTYKGVKSVAYHEKNNFVMTDVKSKLSRPIHEVGDVW